MPDEQKSRVSSGAVSNRERPPAQSSTGEREPRAERTPQALCRHEALLRHCIGASCFFALCMLYMLSAAIVLRAMLQSICIPKKRQQFNGQNTALQRNALPKASVWVLCLFSFENKQIHIPGNSWSKFPRQQPETKGKGPRQGGRSSAEPGLLRPPAWAGPTSTPQGTSPTQSCPHPQAASIYYPCHAPAPALSHSGHENFSSLCLLPFAKAPQLTPAHKHAEDLFIWALLEVTAPQILKSIYACQRRNATIFMPTSHA